MNPLISLVPTVQEAVLRLYKSKLENNLVQLQKTRKEFEGDVTLVLFPLLKISSKDPVTTGTEIGDKLISGGCGILRYNIVKGFLNLTLTDAYWLTILGEFLDEKASQGSAETGARIMVEYASPNTNKPLHLGHLRNIFLGDSVANILAATGNRVIRTQIINDRGIHICKSMYAWIMSGTEDTPQSTGLKGDKLIGKYYVAFDKLMRSQAHVILRDWETNGASDEPENIQTEYCRLKKAIAEKDEEKAKKGLEGKIRDLANSRTTALRGAQEMLVKWESGDAETVLLWKKMNNWVYDGFNATYKIIGVDFDKLYYESETFIEGKKKVEEGLISQVFVKKSDGSVWIDLTKEGLDEKVVQRADGTALYITQDVGTAWLRMCDYPDLNGIIYTVGNEQDYHFKVLFLILEKLGFSWARNCHHLSYGMVELRNSEGEVGKMKSREGTVVDADDLVAEVIESAKKLTFERGHIEGMSEQERNSLCRTIGLGGLKYFLLKVDPKKRMVFNPEESVDLNGNTGPFIQYTHARIKSLLSKAGNKGSIKTKLELNHTEREVAKILSEFQLTVETASAERSPAIIANYAYELAKTYNTFFQTVPVIKAESEDIRQMRLALSLAVAHVIKKAMKLLGIEVPERM